MNKYQARTRKRHRLKSCGQTSPDPLYLRCLQILKEEDDDLSDASGTNAIAQGACGHSFCHCNKEPQTGPRNQHAIYYLAAFQTEVKVQALRQRRSSSEFILGFSQLQEVTISGFCVPSIFKISI